MSLLFFALILLAVLPAPVSGEEAAAIDIVRNPGAYRDRYLTVHGTMMNLRPAMAGGIASPTGTVFDLVAGPAMLPVHSPVPPTCLTGSAVTVEGRFVPMAQIRQQLFTNLIEATMVVCR